MDEALKVILGNNYANDYTLIRKNRLELRECETSYENRVRLELTTSNNCIGKTERYHFLNLFIYKNNSDNVINYILLSRRTNKQKENIGDSYFLAGLKNMQTGKRSMNFTEKYIYNSSSKVVRMKKDVISIDIFYNLNANNDIELTEVFNRNDNKINSDNPISFDLEKIFGSIIKLKSY